MTDREAFIEALAADPDDDTARLAFADWLQEHGEEGRAEYVRLSHEFCARARALNAWPLTAELQRFENRVRALLEARGPVWLAPLYSALGAATAPNRRERWRSRLWRRLAGRPPGVKEQFHHSCLGSAITIPARGPVNCLALEHGFVTRMCVDLGSPFPIQDIAAAFRSEPVHALQIKVADSPGQWERVNAPCVARLRQLAVEVPDRDDPRSIQAFEDVIRGRNWSGVNDLHFINSGLDSPPASCEFAARLAASPLLSSLRALSLDIEQPDLIPLTMSPRIADLCTFWAMGCHLPSEAAAAIASATVRPNLEKLVLSTNRLGGDGARLLASAPWPRLRSLDLSENDLTDAGVRNLLPLVPQLTDLILCGGGITDAGAFALAEAIDAEKLQRFWLSDNPLSAGAVNALRAKFGERFHFSTRA